MNNFTYSKAQNVQEALGKSTLIAGGTNLLDLLKYNVTDVEALVDINALESKIVETENGVRLGALATNADTAFHPLIEQKYPVVAKAILSGASGQIRNMATNGGNLLQRTRCYYFYDASSPCNKRVPGSGCPARSGYNRMMAILGTSDSCIAVFPSDMCVALAALDATVNIATANGERKLAFADFHRLPGDTPHIDNNLKPGEVITSIDLPKKGFEKNYSYLKIRDRNSYAFALVSVATCFSLEDGIIKEARIALGGVAHKPWRVLAAEEYLVGKKAERVHFAKAADLILKGAQGFEHNAFKIDLAKRGIIRNCQMALDPSSQLPGAQPSN
jgi:xanthine dehydrogenase YagS FAD-binding subunit